MSTNTVLFEQTLSAGQLMRVVQGDLTAETVEAIVNAANEGLQHGGGVAGAIRRQGGETIQRESDAWVKQHGPVTTGSAAITGAGNLAANYVIHAVGPVWGSGNDEHKLASAVRSALALADEHQVKTISIPGISSGIFGGPKDICARVIIKTTLDYLAQNPASALEEVRFCNIDNLTAATFVAEARKLLPQE
ncbi:MAG: macro domain-containing protein [Anaerolineales bacterium]|nr:macro domain-containing protein [Anaerolineales bacterium]